MTEFNEAAPASAERFHRTLFIVSTTLLAGLAIVVPPEEVAWPPLFYAGLLILSALAAVTLAALRAAVGGKAVRMTGLAFWLFIAGLAASLIGLSINPALGLRQDREPGPDVMTTSLLKARPVGGTHA